MDLNNYHFRKLKNKKNIKSAIKKKMKKLAKNKNKNCIK